MFFPLFSSQQVCLPLVKGPGVSDEKLALLSVMVFYTIKPKPKKVGQVKTGECLWVQGTAQTHDPNDSQSTPRHLPGACRVSKKAGSAGSAEVALGQARASSWGWKCCPPTSQEKLHSRSLVTAESLAAVEPSPGYHRANRRIGYDPEYTIVPSTQGSPTRGNKCCPWKQHVSLSVQHWGWLAFLPPCLAWGMFLNLSPSPVPTT